MKTTFSHFAMVVVEIGFCKDLPPDNAISEVYYE